MAVQVKTTYLCCHFTFFFLKHTPRWVPPTLKAAAFHLNNLFSCLESDTHGRMSDIHVHVYVCVCVGEQRAHLTLLYQRFIFARWRQKINANHGVDAVSTIMAIICFVEQEINCASLKRSFWELNNGFNSFFLTMMLVTLASPQIPGRTFGRWFRTQSRPRTRWEDWFPISSSPSWASLLKLLPWGPMIKEKQNSVQGSHFFFCPCCWNLFKWTFVIFSGDLKNHALITEANNACSSAFQG